MIFSSSKSITNDNNLKLEKLFNSYKKLMMSIALGILKDQQAAEDVLQIALIKIYKNIDKILKIDSDKARNFVAITVKRVSIDLYNNRKKCAETTYDKMQSEAAVSIEELVVSKSCLEELLGHIDDLDFKYSEVLMLKYVYGYHDNEIADSLHISNENVRVRRYFPMLLHIGNQWFSHIKVLKLLMEKL